MTTESIKAKYDFGFNEGKHEVIRNTFRYGVIGLAVGAILRISMHIFSSNIKVQPINSV